MPDAVDDGSTNNVLLSVQEKGALGCRVTHFEFPPLLTKHGMEISAVQIVCKLTSVL